MEDLLSERGVDVSYEIVQRWSLEFDLAYAMRLSRSRAGVAGHWHLDDLEVH